MKDYGETNHSVTFSHLVYIDWDYENKKEKRLLRKMLRLKENGFSYGDVSKYLTKNRHKTKSGGKWTRQNVYSVMKTFLNNEKITPILV